MKILFYIASSLCFLAAILNFIDGCNFQAFLFLTLALTDLVVASKD